MSALFGPAGNAENFPYKSSADAPSWLREIGLDCYEYQCGKGIHVGEDTARRVGQAEPRSRARPFARRTPSMTLAEEAGLPLARSHRAMWER